MKLKQLRLIFIPLGLAIAFFLAKKLGFSAIWQNLQILSWRAIPIILFGVTWYLCYTLGWKQFLNRLKGTIGIWELFRAKIAGEAVNMITPINFLGGDPVRIYILKKHFSVTEGAASVVVDRTLHCIAILITVFLGIVAAFWRLPFFPLNLRYGLPIVLIIASLFMAFVFTHQKRGFFSFLIHLLRRLHIKKEFTPKTVSKLRELDNNISDFYLTSPGAFWSALMLQTVGKLLGVVEIYIIGRLFSPEFSLYTALLLGALSPIVNFIFAFVPGALGILEGAFSGLLYFLGLPPDIGFSIQVVRRLRAGFWIVVGFVVLGAHNRKRVLHREATSEI